MKTHALRTLAVALGILIGVGLIAPAASVAADDAEISVVWPEVTRFNPDRTPYTFEVHDTGPGVLRAYWRSWSSAEVAPDGPTTMAFSADGVGRVSIQRCVPGQACVVVAESPELEVRRRLHVDEPVGPLRVGPARVPVYTVGFAETGLESVELSWRLQREYSDEVVATGEPTTVTPDESGEFRLPVPIPASLAEDRYDLVVVASTESETFGRRTGESSSRPVDVDSTIKDLTIKGFTPTIYPYDDDYLDGLFLSVSAKEYGTATVDVLDANGDLVRRLVRKGDPVSIAWDGTNAAGEDVPVGRYQVDIEFTDLAGNVASTTRTVKVSDKREVRKVWKRTFPAASTVIGQTVGACSTLSTPARAGWKKSLGYHSLTTCDDEKRDKGVVATTNGVYVPKSLTTAYGGLQISMRGSGVASSRDRPYLVMGYLNERNDTFVEKVVFYGGTTHRANMVDADKFVHDPEGRPYVLWSAGLTAGSRYDVRSFTISLKYTTLV